MAARELRQLGGPPERELEPLELDKSLFIELRGRDIGKDPRIKTQPPRQAVETGTIDKKSRSSSAGSRPSTADALKTVTLSMSSRDLAKTGSKVSFDTSGGARRNPVSMEAGRGQSSSEGGTLPPPKPPQPRVRGGSSTIDSESPETVTLFDIKSEINPDMDEIGRESDGESEGYDAYARYDDDDEHVASSGDVGPGESSGLETTAMSPIPPSVQTRFDQLFGQADEMALPIGERRSENSDSLLRGVGSVATYQYIA